MSGIVFLVFAVLVVVVIRLSIRLTEAEERLRGLADRLREMERGQLGRLPVEVTARERTGEASSAAPRAGAAAAAPIIPPPPPVPARTWEFPARSVTPSPAAQNTQGWVPLEEDLERAEREPGAKADAPSSMGQAPVSPQPNVNLEAFMGVKLFAWLGGLALFLGVVFFVKYSFEHNLITPQMRIGIGALTGLGLIAGGLLTPRPRFTVTAQTLCATGVVILYGVTYGAYAFYHFLELGPAFAVMGAITGGAFVLAVGLEAQVVAILGLLGGFLTPLLLSTGQDNPVFLFTYLAVLDVGLIAVALRRRWSYLVTLAAIATALMQLAWLNASFAPAKISVATTIFLGFEALFLVPFWLRNREDTGEAWTVGASAVSAATALAFAGSLLFWRELGQAPWICLSILLAADAGLVVWPLRRSALQGGSILGGGVAFLVLSLWNIGYLDTDLLKWALGYFLVFAAFHTALPIVLQRLRPSAVSIPRWVQIFPALSLMLMLWPAWQIGASTELWLGILVVDFAAIFLAARTASPLGLAAALVLTLVGAGMWLAQTPVETPALSGLLTVIAVFAALFCGASVFLQKGFAAGATGTPADAPEREMIAHLPTLSAVLPFALLISTVVRLTPADPSAIFGVGLLLVVVLLALARWSGAPALPSVALLCAALLEYCWYAGAKPHPEGWLPIGWTLVFAGVVFLFPLILESRQSTRIEPWAAAAVAPVVHYPLIVETIRYTWPHLWETAGGLVPAALALPALAACFHLRGRLPAENPARLGVLAWFGGVALLFITLIFPTQFSHEWLTLSWALEGAALLWLFHRVPHPGLQKVGFGLLCVAFVRLALNPAVLEYHERSGVPICNWYLYTYGIAAACYYTAGYLTAPPRHRLGNIPLPGVCYSLGTILLFLLVNIEIADCFATSETLTFDFEGNLARDMTYSIAWSLFALALLLFGMHRQIKGVRYAGIGLLVVTLVKLFLHDLASLDQLYRIGAFVFVSVVLIGASYLYQRFLSVEGRGGAGGG